MAAWSFHSLARQACGKDQLQSVFYSCWKKHVLLVLHAAKLPDPHCILDQKGSAYSLLIYQWHLLIWTGSTHHCHACYKQICYKEEKSPQQIRADHSWAGPTFSWPRFNQTVLNLHPWLKNLYLLHFPLKLSSFSLQSFRSIARWQSTSKRKWSEVKTQHSHWFKRSFFHLKLKICFKKLLLYVLRRNCSKGSHIILLLCQVKSGASKHICSQFREAVSGQTTFCNAFSDIWGIFLLHVLTSFGEGMKVRGNQTLFTVWHLKSD